MYFQKGFSILCDISISEYIMNKRLSLAGKDLRTGDCKVIDATFKSGWRIKFPENKIRHPQKQPAAM